MQDTHQADAELRDLWSHRSELTEKEWTRLYVIVQSVLINYKPKELAVLTEDRDVYINEFFQDKVFRSDLLSRCDHIGALRIYYKNYLIDLIRSKQSRSNWEVADKHNTEDETKSSQTEIAAFKADQLDPMAELEAAGILPIEVAESAANWLNENEEWVRIFVAHSNCPDAELSEPLVHLAKRKGIKSQAYKAERLGFNWRGDDLVGFSDTLIGCWIKSLNIAIHSENSLLILAVLKILCFQALSWAEQQEPKL